MLFQVGQFSLGQFNGHRIGAEHFVLQLALQLGDVLLDVAGFASMEGHDVACAVVGRECVADCAENNSASQQLGAQCDFGNPELLLNHENLHSV